MLGAAVLLHIGHLIYISLICRVCDIALIKRGACDISVIICRVCVLSLYEVHVIVSLITWGM